MNIAATTFADLAVPRRRLQVPSAVTLWRPDIVLATSINGAPSCRAVTLAEPAARPEALRTQLGAARSLLAALEGACQALGRAAAVASDGTTPAASIREQVSAAIAAYRAEAALDDALTGTWRRVSLLMEARGLR